MRVCRIGSKNSSLVIIERERNEGAYLDIYQATFGKVAQVRTANYAKHKINQGTKQQLYKLGLIPLYPIYRRYIYENSQNGFIFIIDDQGYLYIQPIGQDIEIGNAVNFTETFLIK